MIGNSSNSSLSQYPWPNDSTTLKTSDQIASDVLFEDVDGDQFREAVFLSTPQFSSADLAETPLILRLVNSADFREQINLANLQTRPHPLIKMVLVDIDRQERSAKELIYISQDLLSMVAVSLDRTTLGEERFKHTLVSPLDLQKHKAITTRPLGWDLILQIGGNNLVITPEGDVSLESSTTPINGDWTPWSDPSSCSKVCGDGKITYYRVCSNPVPRNGGNYCSGSPYSQTNCRLRDCVQADCGEGEIFNDVTKNCVRDPDWVDPDGEGGGGGGSRDPLNPFPQPPSGSVCPQGKQWDPFMYRCYTPYFLNNIRITYVERLWFSRDEGGPRDITHTYRLSLSHPKAVGMSAKETAGEYCRFRGYSGVLTYGTENFNVGTENKNTFILCNIATNGMYYGRGGCPVGSYIVSFAYREGSRLIQHQDNENMNYLKWVTCRRDDGTLPLVAPGAPASQ